MSETSPEANDSMRVLITGATGLVGSHLSEALTDDGHRVYALSRRQSDDERMLHWQPADGQIESERMEGFDAVVHLAGENIFGLWTSSKKERIHRSRQQGTRLLAEALADLDDPPGVLVSASGIDYYGDTGDEEVDEAHPAGETFLARVCTAWEEATEPAAEAGIRTVRARMGVVLSREGGALSMMLPPFKLGLGAAIGSGDQYMSWVSMTDVVAAYRFLIARDDVEGAVNLTSPQPVTNAEFTETLGRVLGRPTFLSMPSFLVKLGAGQMGREMLLNSRRAVPQRLNENGFEFRCPELEAALRREIGE